MRNLKAVRDLFENRIVVIVARQKDMTIFSQPFHDFRFRESYLFQTGKIAHVLPGNRRDDGNMRAYHFYERANFVGMVHANFEDTEISFPWQTRQGQRHTPVIIERCGGSMHCAAGRQDMPQHFLGRGFPHGTSHRDDLSGRTGSCSHA